MIAYQVENYHDIEPELIKLYPEHYEELGVSKDFPLDPDYLRYDKLANAGILYCYTCREDGELIGYIIFVIQTALHYKTCMVAMEDIYYLRKDKRKGRLGIKMFQFAEEELNKLNVNRIVYGTKTYSDNSKLFEYLGYTFYEKLYTKTINKDPLER